MDAHALRELQAPLKDRYRQAPAAALVTLHAEGDLGAGVACSVATGKALVEAGLHPATGGSGAQACSGDMLLELTERYCVVLQSLRAGLQVRTTSHLG